MTVIIEVIAGSEGAERVLLYLAAGKEGYASSIASAWGMDVSTVQNQLKRMERDGLLVSQLAGKTRVYTFNPRYAFKNEVQTLLNAALNMLPELLWARSRELRRIERGWGQVCQRSVGQQPV